MGVHSYAFASEREPVRKVNDRNDASTLGDVQFHFWGKHVQLDSWMTTRAFEHGHDGSFNGDTMELDVDDLCQLSIDLLQGEVYPLQNSEYFTIRLRDDMEFIAKAREQIAQGRYVYYTNSW